MTAEIFVNSEQPGTVTPVATLAQIAQATDTMLVISAALPSSLQTGGQFRVLLDNEIVIIPAQTGTTLTGVTRGAEGSTATAHAAGADLIPELTAGALVNAIALAEAAAIAASDPAGTATGLVAAEAGTRATADTTLAGEITAEVTRAETVEAGKLTAASNLSDVADAGSSRANLHVPALTPAAAVSTTTIASLTGLPVVDGYQTVANDLLLLTGQTTASQNGLWSVASVAWSRPTEMGHGVTMKARTVAIIQGTAHAGETWLLQTNGTVTVDTTAQTWVRQLPSSVVSASSPPTAAGQVLVSTDETNTDGVWQAALVADTTEAPADKYVPVYIASRSTLGFKPPVPIDLYDYGVDFTGNSAAASANLTAIEAACADAQDRANVDGRTVPIRGAVGDTYMSGPIPMFDQMNLQGPSRGFGGGEGWTIENHSTAVFSWPSANQVKRPVIKNINIFGDSSQAGNGTYQTYPFDTSVYATKTLWYPQIEDCSFQYFAGMKLNLLGGEINPDNIIHFSGPVQLAGYDFRFGNAGLMYMGMDSFVLGATSGDNPSGTAITAINLAVPLSVALKQNAPIALQNVATGAVLPCVVSAAVPSGASTITVTSVTPSVDFPSGIAVVGGANLSTPGIIIENPNYAGNPTPALGSGASNVGVGDIYFTQISGGRTLLARNVSGLNIKGLGCDGYNVANTSQYGMAGAGIYLLRCIDVDIDTPRMHGTMGGPTQDGTTAPLDPGSITLDNSFHVSLRGVKYIYLPTSQPTLAIINGCGDINENQPTFDTVDGKAVYYQSGTLAATPAPSSAPANLKTDQNIVAPAGATGIPLFASPTAWNNSTAYTAYVGGSTPVSASSVTRSGAWYGCLVNNTNVDPATDGGTHWVLLAAAGAGADYLNTFGDGSDGAVALNGTNTFTFASLNGSTYTLTRDIMASSITISSGVTLQRAGYAVRCTGIFTRSAGSTDSAAGGNATSSAGGAAGGGSSTYIAGGAGATGGTGVGTAGNGGAMGGGSGSAGGSGASGAGGAGGGVTTTAGRLTRLNTPAPAAIGVIYDGGTARIIGGGAAGGAGAGDGTNKGGSSGGGGGAIVTFAETIVTNGTVTAAGGNGFTPTTGNCGGGAPGSGGLILEYTLNAITGTGTYTVAAGTAGSGVGTGSAGVAGVAGNLIQKVLS